MRELSRAIRALSEDLTGLRTEIERFRTELCAVADLFLDHDSRRGEQPGKAEGTGPLPGCSRAPISGEKMSTDRVRSG